MKRPMWTIMSITLLLTLIVSHGQAVDKVRFGNQFRLNPHYSLPSLAALDKGFWNEMGLEMEYFPFDSATTMHRAVVARDIDMGIDGLISHIQGMVAGIPEVVVADPGISTEFYFWVRSDSPLRKPQDVKGTKIGVTRFGGDSHSYARAVVKALGIDEKEVRFVAMGGGGPQMAGLRSGAIDISSLSNFTMLAVKVKGDVRELLKAEDHIPRGLAAQVLFARRDFLEKKPELVKRGVKGFLRGAEFVLKNRDWAISKMMADVKYPEEVAKAAFPLLSYDPTGRVEEAKIKNVVEFAIEYGMVAKEKAPSFDKVFVRGFAD